MPDVAVRVTGVKELRRGLQKANRETAHVFKAANMETAEAVIAGARRRAASVSPPSWAGRPLGRAMVAAAGTLKASRSATKAAVRLGGARTPWAVGYEFGSGGSKRRRGGHTRMFAAHRGSGPDAGYFLYPEIRHMRQTPDQVADLYLSNLERLLAQAGLALE